MSGKGIFSACLHTIRWLTNLLPLEEHSRTYTTHPNTTQDLTRAQYSKNDRALLCLNTTRREIQFSLINFLDFGCIKAYKMHWRDQARFIILLYPIYSENSLCYLHYQLVPLYAKYISEKNLSCRYIWKGQIAYHIQLGNLCCFQERYIKTRLTLPNTSLENQVKLCELHDKLFLASLQFDHPQV